MPMVAEARSKNLTDATDIGAVLALAPVIPVATITRLADAVPLAEALVEGGVPVIEVTLRSEVALAAIEAIRRSVPDMNVGAGTLWTAQQTMQAASAGAEFIVSPGIADAVQEIAATLRLPYLSGAQTASEVAHLVRRGAKAVKFFPAAPAGGAAALVALSAVFPGLKFCPTGGISEATAPDYLKLACVPCVGGSWLATSSLLGMQDWRAIADAARRARDLAVRRG
jgi:2-dehydro-3-deoxyphosphogluconate aldolase/(4S)-4-hydroxy-2-oxoglutarate aldolase